MLYLLDTNVISDLIFRNVQVEKRLSELSAEDVVLTSVTVLGEVRYGIERLAPGDKRAFLEAHALQVFELAPPQPVPVEAAAHYARLKRDCEHGGTPMNEADLWIAATAIALNATLMTRDKDFTALGAPPVVDWTQ